MPTVRAVSNVLDGGVYLVEEISTEIARLGFVVLSRRQHLFFRGTQKANRLHLIAFRASRITSAAGRAAISPFLYA